MKTSFSEADFQGKFGRWLREHGAEAGFTGGCAFELKLIRVSEVMKRKGRVGEKCLSFARVEVHQEAALAAVECLSFASGIREDVRQVCEDARGLYFKLTDLSLGAKPFDCVWFCGGGARGYVVVGVVIGGGRGVRAIFVRIGAWLELRRQCEAVGRTSARVRELEAVAEYVVEI